MSTDQLHALGEDISRLYARLQSAQDKIMLARKDTVSRLVRAMTLRECLTGAHMTRVGLQAAVLANSLGQDEDYCALLSVAALLHDIGKIAITDNILMKPGKLTPEESEIIKLHTRYGSQLLQPDDFDPLLQMAAEIALYHHEWFDGNGYPYGLGGDSIPLSARIVAVLDVADAMGEVRPYRGAHAPEEIKAYLISHSGSQFDPMVIEAFLALPQLTVKETN